MLKSSSKHFTNINKICFLGALCLFLATIEFLIPKPMPFLKLGIANLPILILIRKISLRQLVLLVIIKILGQGIITGTLLSYIAIFSLCASSVSALIMYFTAKLPPKFISIVGISAIGAIASNSVQLFLALQYFFPGTASILIPWSLSFGLGSGIILGLLSLKFSKQSVWLASFKLDEERSYEE